MGIVISCVWLLGVGFTVLFQYDRAKNNSEPGYFVARVDAETGAEMGSLSKDEAVDLALMVAHADKKELSASESRHLDDMSIVPNLRCNQIFKIGFLPLVLLWFPLAAAVISRWIKSGFEGDLRSK